MSQTPQEFFNAWVQSESAEQQTIAVKKIYIDITGSLTDGVLFSQIMYWHGVGKNGQPRLQVNRGGYLWLVKGNDDWYEECRINAETARKALKRLEDRGLIVKEVHRFGGLAKVHIRVVPEVFQQAINDPAGFSQRQSAKKAQATQRTKSDTAKSRSGKFYRTDGSVKNTEPETVKNTDPLTETTGNGLPDQRLTAYPPSAAGRALSDSNAENQVTGNSPVKELESGSTPLSPAPTPDGETITPREWLSRIINRYTYDEPGDIAHSRVLANQLISSEFEGEPRSPSYRRIASFAAEVQAMYEWRKVAKPETPHCPRIWEKIVADLNEYRAVKGTACPYCGGTHIGRYANGRPIPKKEDVPFGEFDYGTCICRKEQRWKRHERSEYRATL